MLDSKYTIAGKPHKKQSPFFIPTLYSAQDVNDETKSEFAIRFQGELLLHCNLSFLLATTIGTEALLHRFELEAKGLVSEKEAFGKMQGSIFREAPAEADVTNKSEPKANGDDKVVEGGKEVKSYWLLIVIIMAFILLIILVIAVVLAVRWRKVKNEAKDLREIVNDTVKKDPKLIEMVTMEMSPEEQWRRAEREAEKKNDERMKKRIYDTNMQHSESSEHLLSESGSTEYILGKDSDKIPKC
ncbi:uncharacterized protein MONOS_555 [Monocercomonoides exilis]|uniref:uncharacterized protein n=1 Tax=Monocercomonoides exilis TaxID=2049356 RepID=UPI00355953F5|nr:hypothetical protein MONOS_555 [Monocercomonoides exilis]|eukprot:MONOS_555.1-p1 / transcript=MONOS_555.1 / gene=MONOS_555 / organism=Monocercomonoides_exilis_PA203 / gene_product=unspecified product / transcript_product=unspecified product / location=Mono_scaffold00009:24588-25376(-) / protein_length=243 / sequence_SO=supercontig / SO=protein_coding / is_pseudo=false